uniref:FCP1 homology domain-containing protein n=1 Tax=viral metagenome TaxID=1070528 RepID=A0A6C0CIB1_9ZZZZ
MRSCSVIDLDSTMVHIWGDEHDWFVVEGESRPNATNRLIDIKFDVDFMWGTRRPYTDEFLHACYNHFDLVGVWSAGIGPYVNEIVEEVFISRGFNPDFIWSKKDCVRTFHEESGQQIYQKPLTKLYNQLGNIDPNRTLLFDDNVWACEQDPLNHVLIPAWCGDLETLHIDDHSLLRVSKWIEQKVASSRNYKMLSLKGVF